MAEESPKPPESAEELLRRYAAGEREFARADLRNMHLSGVDLSNALLRGADLSGAHLDGVDLSGASLSGADLSGAHVNANLSRANLSDAKLRGTYLMSANLESANLSGAEVSGVYLSGTLLVDIDLGLFCDADPPVVHYSPSFVDFRSIIRAVRSPNLSGPACPRCSSSTT
jgi:uncharacterized protein YjbI with pentapeptide repeats